MKITLSWLERYCSHGLSAEVLAEKLTMSGTEVEDIERVGDDTVFTLEVTSNRPDLLGVLGIAREVSAFTGTPLREPEADFTVSVEDVASITSVRNQAKDLCPLYTAKVISGVRVNESPDWLKNLLTSVGVRPVNNIVDVTNFIMFETGQPLHAFDLDKLEKKKIVVRRARAKEILISIDGTECRLSGDDLVIADAKHPVAIAGIMGGLNTEVDQSTRNILLESAMFDSLTIRQTSRRLALSSDSSYRFERGVTAGTVMFGSDRACRLILETAGGSAANGTITSGKSKKRFTLVQLRWDRLNKLLGTEVPRKEAVSILKKLGFSIEKESGKRVTIAVPEFRRDIEREVDLIEEVVRVWGYDKIPSVPTMKVISPQKERADIVASTCRTIMAGLGFYEVMTPSFVNKEDSFDLWTDADALSLGNPVREGEPLLRKTLIGSVLRSVKANEDRGNHDCRFFELARIYLPGGDKLAIEKTMLTALCPKNFNSLKGTLQHILDRFGISVSFKKSDSAPFEAERSAEVYLGNTRLAWIGDVSTRNMTAFEMDMDVLCAEALLFKKCPDIPRFPPVTRDYAFILDDKVTWDALEALVRLNGASLVESVIPFDIFRSDEIGTGRKSVAFSVVYRLPDRTLTGQEVDEVQSGIVAALKSKLGGILRG